MGCTGRSGADSRPEDELGRQAAGRIGSNTGCAAAAHIDAGARPVIVSGNPVGFEHARNVLNKIVTDAGFLTVIDRQSLRATTRLYVIRYLAASTIAVSGVQPGLAAKC